jgi:acyl-CoA dehydrogenase
MDFAFDERTEKLRADLLAFMDSHVYPAEPEFERTDPEAPFSWERPKVMAELQAEARRRGLWNLFLPHSERGAGLSNLQYAPLAEITGRSPQIAPEALNCAAPDTGNMELLHMFGTPSSRNGGWSHCSRPRSARRSA